MYSSNDRVILITLNEMLINLHLFIVISIKRIIINSEAFAMNRLFADACVDVWRNFIYSSQEILQHHHKVSSCKKMQLETNNVAAEWPLQPSSKTIKFCNELLKYHFYYHCERGDTNCLSHKTSANKPLPFLFLAILAVYGLLLRGTLQSASAPWRNKTLFNDINILRHKLLTAKMP